MNAKTWQGRRLQMKTKLVSLVAAGILASGIAAHAEAMAPDPNLAPTTSGEEARIAPTSPDSPQLAVAPDPNVGPSTTVEEARIQPTSPDSPQLAVAPDPNLGEPAMQTTHTSGATVAMR
jgi:hypothetical protein